MTYSANSVPCYCGQCGPVPDGVRPTSCRLAWYRNDRGVRDPEQAFERHQEDERSYVRALQRGIAGTCIAGVLLAGAGCREGVKGVQVSRVTHQKTVAAFDIPATDEGGRVWHVCETLPRTYQGVDGQVEIERDHYISEAECPKETIQ